MTSVYDELLARGFTPQQINELMQLGVLAGEQDLVAGDVERAYELEDTAMPRGRQAGRIYVASNPLEHLAAGLRRTAGTLGRRRARDRQEEILQEMARLRRSALLGLPTTRGSARTTVGAAPSTATAYPLASAPAGLTLRGVA